MTIEEASSDLSNVRAERRWFGPLRPESDTMLHLDMLRFVASAGVLWHHSHEFLVPATIRAALIERTQALALFVDLFFVISGYVITQVYSCRLKNITSYRYFLQRRVGRLVPLHWLTLLLSLILWTLVDRTGAAVDSAPDRSLQCVLQTALLLNGLFPCGNGIALNSVTWSISAEMALYVLFPAFLLAMRRSFFVSLTLIILFAGLAITATRAGRWDDVHPLLRAIPSFLIGMMLFKYRLRLPVVNRSWPVIGLAIGVLAIMMSGVSQFITLAAVYTLAALAVAADQRQDAPQLVRTGAALGQLTYGVYMWHTLFILVIINAFGDKYLRLTGVRMAVLFILSYLVIFIWSYISLRLFETPSRRLVDRW